MSNDTRKVDKEDFLSFLASATPEDLNRLILEQGKPPKPWEPIYFYRDIDHLPPEPVLNPTPDFLRR